MSILEIKNVTKKFGKKTIINDMSFSVEEGEVYGFLGPNGSGKTTVIKMIMGLLKITKGEILVGGYNISKDYEKAAAMFGGIIENPAMYGELKGSSNLKFFSTLYPTVTKERINEVVELVGLKDRIDEPIKKYSLGMKQRLGLALALIHNPKILILDEPTNGLDPKGIKELRDILRNLAKNGTAVLVSSHLLSEMELMCDRVCIIDKGKVLEIKDLKQRKNVTKVDDVEEKFQFIYKTDDNEKLKKKLTELGYDLSFDENEDAIITTTKEDIKNLNTKLINSKINIYTVEQVKKSLEEIYMETTEKKGGNK